MIALELFDFKSVIFCIDDFLQIPNIVIRLCVVILAYIIRGLTKLVSNIKIINYTKNFWRITP